ncbi:MAG TPA: hypothetical protein VFP54_08410 [Acidimicrobiales bacterium]|nr:hypothetical protein [Acidimicrobiales bacterium]
MGTRRALSCLGGAAVVALVLWAAGGLLPAPPLTHPSGWLDWAAGNGPAVTTIGILRLATTAVDAWLAAVSVLWVGAAVLDSALLTRAARSVTPRWVGAILAVSSTAGAAVSSPAWAATSQTMVMRPAPPAGVPPTGAARTTQAQAPVVLPPSSRWDRPSPLPAEPEPTVHVVTPGDSFWSIAEMIVSARVPEASTAAVAQYWLSLLSANRPLLPDPGDPDVLYPGDRVLLPPLSTAD